MSGILSGNVIDRRTLKPVRGARVSALFLGVQDATRTSAQRDVTSAVGGFMFGDLEAGAWRIDCKPNSGPTVELHAHVYDDAVTAVEISIDGGAPDDFGGDMAAGKGGVSGKVIEAETGSPIENASVTIVSGAGAAPDIAPMTDENGVFALGGLPAGEWVFEARTQTGDVGRGLATVSPGDVATIIIVIGSSIESAWR